MYETAYEIAAVALRYWFALLIIFILLKIAQNVRAELIAERTVKTLAKGFSLGVVTIVAPESLRFCGKQFVLKRENTIGHARRCDIQIKHNSVFAVHAAIYQKNGEVFLSNYSGKGKVHLNGEKLTKKDAKLFDEDEITIGQVILVISIKGIEKRQPVYDDSSADEETDEEVQAEAQDNDDIDCEAMPQRSRADWGFYAAKEYEEDN